MAQNVNVNFSPLAKGTNISVSRWSCTETITWQDDNGVQKNWQGTINYPDDLALMTTDWQKQKLLELIFQGSRIKLGIDGG